MSEKYQSSMLESFRKWAPFYDAFTVTIGSARRAVVAAVAPERGGKVLDICTGTGAVALELARAGASVTGIDLSEDMLRHARRKSAAQARTEDVRFLRMDATELSFPADEFDAVTISFALHEMPPEVIARVLREAHRVARRRLVVIDYRLPDAGLLAGTYRFVVGLYEGPFCMDFLELDVPEVAGKEGFALETRNTALLRTCQILSFHIVK